MEWQMAAKVAMMKRASINKAGHLYGQREDGVMAEQELSERQKKRLKLLAIIITLLIIVAMLVMAIFFKYLVSLLG